MNANTDWPDLPLPLPLPDGVRSRIIADVNGLDMHVLESGFQHPGRPLLLLLHGFPELAYSWRKVMVPLSELGFHVVAPDQRGYGRTTGWDADYDGDLAPFRLLGIATDTLALVAQLGCAEVACVVGHDFGSPVAGWCALARPDVFKSVVMMSAPFEGAPGIIPGPGGDDVHSALAALERPRKHYQWYYSTRPANHDMIGCTQGLHDFLRAYYHHKSADWPGNTPFRLAGWNAQALAELPTYYVMDLCNTMAETVAPEMPDAASVAQNQWLPDAELSVYVQEFQRTGLQGGLNWYRCGTSNWQTAELRLFAGRNITVPSAFIAGAQDWGIYQRPGALEAMQSRVCEAMCCCELVDGAGHWVQQEQPQAVTDLLDGFLRR